MENDSSMVGVGMYANDGFDDKPTQKVATPRRTPAGYQRQASEVPTEKLGTGKGKGKGKAPRMVDLPRPGQRPRRSLVRVLPWVLCLMVTVGAGMGVFYMFEKYRIAEDELIEVREAMQASRQEMTAADNKIMKLEAELSRLRGDFATSKKSGETAADASVSAVDKVADATSAN